MKRRGRRVWAIGITGSILAITAVISIGVLSRHAPAADSVSVLAPHAAFSVAGTLPAGWRVQSASTEYVKLQGSNGCFATATMAVREDYDNLSSVDRFNAAFGPRFVQQGYVLSGVSRDTIAINRDGSQATASAIAYALTMNADTTYHVDAGVMGKNNTAFVGLSCTNTSTLPSAQAALLALRYNDTYRPLSGATKQ